MPSKPDKPKQFSLRSLFLVTLAVCGSFAIVRLAATESSYIGVSVGMIIWIVILIAVYVTQF